MFHVPLAWDPADESGHRKAIFA